MKINSSTNDTLIYWETKNNTVEKFFKKKFE